MSMTCLSSQMTVFNNPAVFVGLDLQYFEDGLAFSQTRYIEKMAQLFRQHESNPVDSPMEFNLTLSISEELNDDTEYRAIIGALLYVAWHSRPDIAYSVNKLSQHQGRVTSTVKAYARRVIQYLFHTRSYHIVYTHLGSVADRRNISAFIDAAFVKEEKSRSCTRYIFYNGTNPVHWNTKLQTLVTSSSTAAEIMAIADASDDLLAIKHLLFELFGNTELAIVYEYYLSASRTIEGRNTKRMRYVLIKSDLVSLLIEKKLICVAPVPGKFQLADPLTKALPASLLKQFTDAIFGKN